MATPLVTPRAFTRAFTRACTRRRQQPGPGLRQHCERGREYASDAYRLLSPQNGVQPSMGRAGNCHDHAAVEPFRATLKTGTH